MDFLSLNSVGSANSVYFQIKELRELRKECDDIAERKEIYMEIMRLSKLITSFEANQTQSIPRHNTVRSNTLSDISLSSESNSVRSRSTSIESVNSSKELFRGKRINLNIATYDEMIGYLHDRLGPKGSREIIGIGPVKYSGIIRFREICGGSFRDFNHFSQIISAGVKVGKDTLPKLKDFVFFG